MYKTAAFRSVSEKPEAQHIVFNFVLPYIPFDFIMP